jgi:hypothetical protein
LATLVLRRRCVLNYSIHDLRRISGRVTALRPRSSTYYEVTHTSCLENENKLKGKITRRDTLGAGVRELQGCVDAQ